MKREYNFQANGHTRTVSVEDKGAGWTVTVGGEAHEVEGRAGESGRLVLEIDGRRVLAHVARQGLRVWVHVEGQVWALERVSRAQPRRVAEPTASGPLIAAMPGRVLDVLVADGAAVRKGQTLLLLEAMKMELRVAAPADGIVRRVHVKAGQVIARGEALVEIEGA